jgi:hypothetical protein
LRQIRELDTIGERVLTEWLQRSKSVKKCDSLAKLVLSFRTLQVLPRVLQADRQEATKDLAGYLEHPSEAGRRRMDALAKLEILLVDQAKAVPASLLERYRLLLASVDTENARTELTQIYSFQLLC